ncbi:MAG: signal peptidase I [Acidimicrobiia bacterium]
MSSTTIKSLKSNSLVEIGVIIVIAGLVAVIVRMFFLGLYFIPSVSMVPTLNVNDKIFVNKMSYKFHDIERGDIVVFKAPESVRRQRVNGKRIDNLVKRVIGLPGETIEGRCKNDENQCRIDIYINNKKLNEPYVGENIISAPFSKETIPLNSFFMMGDNRGESQDSRFFGSIPEDQIIGRAFFKLWPGFSFL